MSLPVVIVGGGLAGLAAAVRLADARRPVVLLETRPRLGGRATSFEDPRSGRVLDNCQHVVLGCCVNLLDFYERLGVLDEIEWHREFFWANPPHEPDRMAIGRLPAPLHFTRSFLAAQRLSVREKWRLAMGMRAVMRLGRAGRIAWADRPFSEFLADAKQGPRLVEQFWSPVIVSACNLEVDQVGAACALHVVQDGFLAHPMGAAMGLARGSLRSLYDPAEAILAAAGGGIRTGISVKSIAFDGRRATGVHTDEGPIEASSVIAAVPPDRLAKLLPPPLRAADGRFAHLEAIGTSPILGVHLFFAERFTELPHLVLPSRATQWLFMKGLDEQGAFHVHAVISAADAWMGLSEAEIAMRVLVDLRWAFPRARIADPIEVRSVKEKRATFAAVPGVDRLRPRTRPTPLGGVDNLLLAGDWCDTGWPATMEGAVRSGYAAAAALLDDPTGGLLPELPTARLAHWLGLRGE